MSPFLSFSFFFFQWLKIAGGVQVKSALIFVDSNVPLFYRIDLISSVELFFSMLNIGHVQFCCNTRMCIFLK